MKGKDYDRLCSNIIEEGHKAGFQVKLLDTLVYGKDGFPFFMLRSESKMAKYNGVITASAHGDEWWGTDCLIQSLSDLDTTLWNLWIFPVINPFGWKYQSRVNGAKQGINWHVGERLTPELSLIFKNSPTKVSLFCDIHGDADKSTVYAYERKIPGVDSLAKLALKDVESYFELETAKKVYKEPCRGGVVTSGQEGTLEEYFYEQKGAKYSITLEIPGRVTGTGVNRIAGGARLLVSTLNNFDRAMGQGTKKEEVKPKAETQPEPKKETPDVGRDGGTEGTGS